MGFLKIEGVLNRHTGFTTRPGMSTIRQGHLVLLVTLNSPKVFTARAPSKIIQVGNLGRNLELSSSE